MRIPGVILLAIALALIVWTVILMSRAGTTPNPTRPTTALVIRGPFHFTRNPMYLGWLPIGLGWAVYLQNPVPLLLVPLFMGYITVFQIRPEERALETKFGPAYDAYRRRVRRWL